MKGNHAIITAMTTAGVPRSCWSVSVTGTGRAAYRDFAKESLERNSRKEMQVAAYVRYQNPDGVLDVELLAKEFVLAGVATVHTSFAKLMRDLRLEEANPEGEHRLSQVYSVGAIVLPNVPFASDYQDTPIMAQYSEAVEYLIGHVYEGGVLVVGGSHRLSKTDTSKWPPLFTRMIIENAKIFEVK